MLDIVSSVALSDGDLRGSITPFSRACMMTTAALKVPSGLSAAAMQDAVLSLSLLCAGEAESAPEFAEIFGENGGDSPPNTPKHQSHAPPLPLLLPPPPPPDKSVVTP